MHTLTKACLLLCTILSYYVPHPQYYMHVYICISHAHKNTCQLNDTTSSLFFLTHYDQLKIHWVIAGRAEGRHTVITGIPPHGAFDLQRRSADAAGDPFTRYSHIINKPLEPGNWWIHVYDIKWENCVGTGLLGINGSIGSGKFRTHWK